MHITKYIELTQKYQPHPETENKNYMFEKDPTFTYYFFGVRTFRLSL